MFQYLSERQVKEVLLEREDMKISGRRYLTEEELAMAPRDLQSHLGLGRASAWKARKQGWFCPNHHNSKKNQGKRRDVRAELEPLVRLLEPGEKVVLSALEMALTQKGLCRRYKIGKEKARKALIDGFFIVNGSPTFKGPEKWRPATPANYDPKRKFFRVNLATEELNLPANKLVELYSFWGMSLHQAKDAKVSGYFCPNVAIPFEPQVDEVLFESLLSEVLVDAKKGVTIALRKYFGGVWKVKMKGYDQDDLLSEALEHLRQRSGYPEFAVKKWRIATAKFGVLAFLGREARRRKREATTVDQMEGRFE